MNVFRQSSYNVIIPLSFEWKPSEAVYLISNPLYGEASLINEKEYTALFNFSDSGEDAIVSELNHAGYITRLTKEEEKTLMKNRYESRKELYDPKAAIVVTYNCNFQCTYCWVDHVVDSDTARTTVIDEKMVDAVFSTIPEIPALTSVHGLSFYGGEPFLPSTLPIVTYILKKGSEKDYSFHANTNGYYLDRFVPVLAQYPMDGLGITLDGCRDVHDNRRMRIDGEKTFDQIVAGVDAALDAGITIGIRMNVDSYNICHLPAFYDWVKEHGWAQKEGISFSIALVRPGKNNHEVLSYAEMGEKMVNIAKEEPSLVSCMPYTWEYTVKGYLSRTVQDGTELLPRPFYCSAHCKGFVFDLFGDIYSCPRGVGDKAFCIGQYVPALQFNENYEQWFNRDVLSIPDCQLCELAFVCGGGCAYEAFLQSNTIYKGYCERYKAFLKYGLPLYVKQRMMQSE